MDNNEALALCVAKGSEKSCFNYARIERLLHEGADPDAKLWGASLLHALAACKGDGARVVARLLLEFGASLEARDTQGSTPVLIAVRSGNVELAAEFARRGASLRARDARGIDAMGAALEAADEETARMLLEAGYPAEHSRAADGRPALVAVAEHPRAAAVGFELLHRGADPELADEDGWTPMTTAARAGNAPMVSVLLSAGARYDAPGPSGFSALAIALGARSMGAKPGGSRVGPAHMACALMLAKCESPGWGARQDAGGWPPLARLYRSIARFEPAWMGKLAESGADPRAQGRDGWGLLRLAAEVGAQACGMALARFALAAGADPGARCELGERPESVALACEKFDLHDLLRSARERGELGAQVAGSARGSGSGRL